MYKCSNCKLSVIVLPDTEPIKGCKCAAPIIADISAQTFAKAGLSI